MNKTIRLFGYLYKSKNKKMQILPVPAGNRQFGASGGVVSCDTSQEFGSSPPVRALPIPPPAAKLLKRYLSFLDSDTAQKKNCKTK